MADPPRRAADHRAVRGRAGGGVTPDGGTPDGGTPDGGGIAGGPSDGGTPDAGTPSTASTLAQRQDCLEQADQWKDGCETRGDMVCKVVCDSRHRFRVTRQRPCSGSTTPIRPSHCVCTPTRCAARTTNGHVCRPSRGRRLGTSGHQPQDRATARHRLETPAGSGRPRRSRAFHQRARQDSNLRPLAPEASALSTELRARDCGTTLPGYRRRATTDQRAS